MRRSSYGKETAFLWEAEVPATHEQVLLEEVPSTLNISAEQDAKIKEAFAAAQQENPHFFDGEKWRFERYEMHRGGVNILVSPIVYSQHNVLRHEQNRPFTFYPNPISINAIQVTIDGLIPIGVRGKVADQRGLCSLGSGFVERDVDPDSGKNYPPQSIFDVTTEECNKETAYNISDPRNAFNIDDARALGAIFGSNHDTTICVYVPLKIESNYIDLGNLEHYDLLWLSTDYDSLQKFLYDGGIDGIPAADHLLGDIELFALNKMKGYLNREHHRSLLQQ